MAELQKAQLYDRNEVPIVPKIYFTLKEAWGWREIIFKRKTKKRSFLHSLSRMHHQKGY